MRELVKLKYNKFGASYDMVEHVLTKTEYVILDLVTSFTDIESGETSIYSFGIMDRSRSGDYKIAVNVKDILIKCFKSIYPLTDCTDFNEHYFSYSVPCYYFTIKFSEGTPLTLFYVDKDLAESEHLKLQQGYKELTLP